jgi:hypothetical protein
VDMIKRMLLDTSEITAAASSGARRGCRYQQHAPPPRGSEVAIDRPRRACFADRRGRTPADHSDHLRTRTQLAPQRDDPRLFLDAQTARLPPGRGAPITSPASPQPGSDATGDTPTRDSQFGVAGVAAEAVSSITTVTLGWYARRLVIGQRHVDPKRAPA